MIIKPFLSPSHIKLIGLTVVAKPEPHVKWKDLREKLGQWRYGFALRTSYCNFAKVGVRGLKADFVEATLAGMADECKATWPKWWKPNAEGTPT